MSPVGLTYATGRASTRTTESGSPTREAGQFTSYLSCPVRGSEQVSLEHGLTATRGAVIVYLDPDNDHDGAGQPATGQFMFIPGATGGDYIVCSYVKASATFQVQRKEAGAGANLNVAGQTFSAGDAKALYVAWDADAIYFGVDGGTIQSAANTAIPDGLSDTMDVGHNSGSTRFLAGYGAVALFEGPLTQSQWEVLAGLRANRPPCPGEGGTGSAMVGLWVGEGRVVWSFDDVLDLNDLRGNEVLLEQLLGAGLAPLRHRSVTPPLRDGAVYVDTRLGVRRMSAQMTVLSRSTFARVWELRRELVSKTNPALGEGVLTYAPSSILYEIDALPDAQGIALSERLSEFALAPAVPFVSFDPRWRRVVLDETDIEAPGTGLVIPLTIPMEFATGEVVDVSNAGDVETYPTIVIAGEVTDPRIENQTTGQAFELDYTIPAGETATIDMEARTAVLSDGTNLMPYRTAASIMWPLAKGTNAVLASFGSAPSRPVDFSIRRQARYVGV